MVTESLDKTVEVIKTMSDDDLTVCFLFYNDIFDNEAFHGNKGRLNFRVNSKNLENKQKFSDSIFTELFEEFLPIMEISFKNDYNFKNYDSGLQYFTEISDNLLSTLMGIMDSGLTRAKKFIGVYSAIKNNLAVNVDWIINWLESMTRVNLEYDNIINTLSPFSKAHASNAFSSMINDCDNDNCNEQNHENCDSREKNFFNNLAVSYQYTKPNLTFKEAFEKISKETSFFKLHSNTNLENLYKIFYLTTIVPVKDFENFKKKDWIVIGQYFKYSEYLFLELEQFYNYSKPVSERRKFKNRTHYNSGRILLDTTLSFIENRNYKELMMVNIPDRDNICSSDLTQYLYNEYGLKNVTNFIGFIKEIEQDTKKLSTRLDYYYRIVAILEDKFKNINLKSFFDELFYENKQLPFRIRYNLINIEDHIIRTR